MLRAILEAPITTPLKAAAWEKALANHPDQEWSQSLLRGMHQGFCIGLQDISCHSSTSNAPSAREQAAQVTSFVDKQVNQGIMIGHIDSPPEVAGIITCPLAAIPKKIASHWRIIVNLSHPERASVNDNLQQELTHVAYASVEDAALILHDLG